MSIFAGSFLNEFVTKWCKCHFCRRNIFYSTKLKKKHNQNCSKAELKLLVMISSLYYLMGGGGFRCLSPKRPTRVAQMVISNRPNVCHILYRVAHSNQTWFTCSQKWKSDGLHFHTLCLLKTPDDPVLPLLGGRTFPVVRLWSCHVYDTLARQVTCRRHCYAVSRCTCKFEMSHSTTVRVMIIH